MRRPSLSPWLVLVPLAACHDSSSGSPPALFAPGVNDLGGRDTQFGFEDGVIAAGLDEGGVDQNGDGDGNDSLVRVWDVARGRVLTLPIAGDSQRVGGGFVTFLASEASEASDLNGDGDTQDRVVHVLDVRANATRNLGLAANEDGVVQDGALVAFGVEETAQGVDVDGDGTLHGSILHVYEAQLGRMTVLSDVACAYGETRVAGGRVVFLANERETGDFPGDVGGDLDGDGNVDGEIAHVFDAATGALENTGLASASVALEGSRMALRVLGGVEVRDLGTGARRLIAADAANGVGGGLAILQEVVSVKDDETATWAYDFLADALLPLPFGTNLAFFRTEPNHLADRRFAYRTGEEQLGVDVNQDGHLLDDVAAVFDGRTGASTLMQGVCFSRPQIEGRFVAFVGGTTPDAALGDPTTVHVHDLETGVQRDTGLFASDFRLLDGRIFAPVTEHRAEDDLNGDGDRDDSILLVHDARTGSTRNTGAELWQFEGPVVLEGELLVLVRGDQLAAIRLR